jgi:hypothetical protein
MTAHVMQNRKEQHENKCFRRTQVIVLLMGALLTSSVFNKAFVREKVTPQYMTFWV